MYSQGEQSDTKHEGGSSECRRPSTSQDIPHILSNPKVRYSIHNSSPVVLILGRINPVHTSTPYNFTVHCDVILTPITCGVIMELQHPPKALKHAPHYSSVLRKINKRRTALWPTLPPTHSWQERGRCVASNIHPILASRLKEQYG